MITKTLTERQYNMRLFKRNGLIQKLRKTDDPKKQDEIKRQIDELEEELWHASK